MSACNACGAQKPDDCYRACEDCRRTWRLAGRKRGGPADTIDRLKATLARIEALEPPVGTREAENANMKVWRGIARAMASHARAALKDYPQ